MKNDSVTPKHIIVSALRKIWLRSRERSTALKRDKYTCANCGKKQSKAKGREVKINVHHLRHIDWDKIVKYIRKTLLCDPKYLETLCKEDHDKEHSNG